MKTVVIGIACAELNYLKSNIKKHELADKEVITVSDSKELPTIFAQQAKRLTKQDHICGYNFYPNQAVAFKNQLKFAKCKARFTSYTDWVNDHGKANPVTAIERLTNVVAGKDAANELAVLMQSSIWRYRHTIFDSHYETLRDTIGDNKFNELIEFSHNQMSQEARFLLNCIDRVGTTYFNTSLKYQPFLWDYVKQENATLVTFVLTDRLARIEIQTPNIKRLHQLAHKVSKNYTSNHDRVIFFADNSLNQLETLFAKMVSDLDFKHAHPNTKVTQHGKTSANLKEVNENE